MPFKKDAQNVSQIIDLVSTNFSLENLFQITQSTAEIMAVPVKRKAAA